MPHDMAFRLSFKDLAKSWSGFFFLVFAWEAARLRLIGVRDGERGMTLPRLLVGIAPCSWHPD